MCVCVCLCVFVCVCVLDDTTTVCMACALFGTRLEPTVHITSYVRLQVHISKKTKNKTRTHEGVYDQHPPLGHAISTEMRGRHFSRSLYQRAKTWHAARCTPLFADRKIIPPGCLFDSNVSVDTLIGNEAHRRLHVAIPKSDLSSAQDLNVPLSYTMQWHARNQLRYAFSLPDDGRTNFSIAAFVEAMLASLLLASSIRLVARDDLLHREFRQSSLSHVNGRLVEHAQHDPHCPWSFTGVVAPNSLQSKEDGVAARSASVTVTTSGTPLKAWRT